MADHVVTLTIRGSLADAVGMVPYLLAVHAEAQRMIGSLDIPRISAMAAELHRRR